MRKSFVHLLWGLLTVFVLSTAFAFTAIYNGWIGYMPPVEELQNPINRFASQVYSADGKLMGTWNYSRENRIMVDYSNISPYLVKALVATEDVRFYRHSGIDFYALGRAVVKRGLLGQRSAGGGSTITQQLAKQLFSETANSTLERLLQKPIEWVIAVKLERNYTKEEIITMYLNYFDFLHNAVGIKTAANTYFGKEPKNLTVTESATLVGMVKNPSFYNPIRYPERCTERRNIVLQQMAKAGYITTSDYDKYVEEPLSVNYHRIDHKDGNESNNSILNLRVASNSQNMRNASTPSSNKSGVRGVYWNKSLEKWHAQIQIHGKKFHIGYFDSISAAKEARALAAIKKHGDFASELRGLV